MAAVILDVLNVLGCRSQFYIVHTYQVTPSRRERRTVFLRVETILDLVLRFLLVNNSDMR